MMKIIEHTKETINAIKILRAVMMLKHKTFINRISHSIKHYLSFHVSIANLKKISFFISLFSCLSSGSIMLFSLFSSSLHELYGISYLHINFIASLSAVGMYLCLPVLGYLADCYGPSLLSLILIWFFVPSYFVNAQVVKSLEYNNVMKIHLYAFGICFFFIGLATSSLYFLSLLTCAKIYPEHKGLAISLPVTCYGLSTLLGSQLMKLSYFKQYSGLLSLRKVFNFFGVLYLVMGVLNFVSSSVVSMESEIIFTNEDEMEEADEELPLVTSRSRHSHHSCEDDDNLIPERAIIEPLKHQERFINFLKDKSAWLLLASLILNIGPMESFQNNLGSIIINSNSESNLSDQVSIMAASSTVTRLAMGGLSDYLSSSKRKFPICRVNLLIINLVVGIVGQFMVTGLTRFSVVSILNGSSYGGLFTIYPTIVASIWGIDMMGSTWGSFMIAPAIGSIGFSIFYGNEVDNKCSADYSNCLQHYFSLTAVGLSVSLILIIIVWKGIWAKRGFRVF